ncbi:NlpC/P60 family peptidoglycan endopeptidase RipB [Mycobacterium sp. AMU20-3851]|uniref:NlpC/P60 family peptidoglycan endopeptidase RipB n=1 Tax=Mycobacterium sp. AMU20-3851 TaxID=3122055 RepID=UPI003754D699
MNSKRFRSLNRVLATLALAGAMAIGAATPATAAPGEWDPTLPARPSSGAPGDPVAIANASFEVSRIALETTQNLGSKFLQSIGLAPAPAASAGGLPMGARVRGPQAIEYVIRRGGSQLGVPYSWGGGTLTGPGPGVDYDTGKIGYDCSGFTRYAFAGVGVQIPKYSGDQYNAGRPIQPSQAKRGDLIFWGPGGSQHVAIYLGGGKMLEASGSADKVTVSPLRTAGMSPHLVRIIES